MQRFVVTIQGHGVTEVEAASALGAKAKAFLRFPDISSSINFREFSQRAVVRVVGRQVH